MTIKKMLLFVFMLCSFTILSAQTKSNLEVESAEMEGHVITRVKLAKEYYMTSTDSDAGQTFDERTKRLSLKVKEIFNEYREKRLYQNKSGTRNAALNELIATELKHIRMSLNYMNLPTDL
jgi:hypothetical protein